MCVCPLNANLAKNLSLADLAAQCDLSAGHFSRAFKRSAGVSAQNWLNQRRVEAAKTYMRHGDVPLAAIAINCGFADQSHFTKMFARYAGQTQAAWRRLNARR
jgi:AraC family transcriptional regulator